MDAVIGLFWRLIELTNTAADAVFGVVWQLVELINTPLGRALLGVLVLGGAVWRWGKSLVLGVRRGWNSLRGISINPRVTVRLVPEINRSDWDMPHTDGKPAMHVHGRLHATNLTDKPVRLVKAHIRHPYTEGQVLVEGARRSIVGEHTVIGGVLGSYEIPPHEIKRIEFSLSITPPVRKAGKDFKTPIVITDDLGNEHQIKKFVFKSKEKK